jgi:DNA (cytosine-5)-methyltransferase 1
MSNKKNNNTYSSPTLFSGTKKISAKKNKKDITFIDLFAGIGGFHIAFRNAGAECVFASEWDEHARKTYIENFYKTNPALFDGGNFAGDITKVDKASIPDFDILTGGFPCQPFSQAGLKKGFEDTRGTLFFDIARIVEHHKPSVVFLENVRNLASHNKGNTLKVIIKTLEDLGYTVFHRLYNAKNFGIPQNRVRIYIIAFKDKVDFEFPKEPNTPTKLGDILEKKVDPKYTISDKLWAGHQRRRKEHKEKGNGFGYSLFNEKSEYTSTISARYYKDGSEILIEQKGKNPRKLTPKEASRLQGFPENFIIPVSDNQAYKQFGNSVAVPVIKVLAKQIIKTLKKLPTNSLKKYENK